MTTALVFPGQGESLGPALQAWYSCCAEVRSLVDHATAALGTTTEELNARGGRALRRTSVYQPLATALSLGILRSLGEAEANPAVVAGHSLGEIAALAASGAISDEAAVRLALRRGALMEAAAEARPGGMAALRMAPGRALDRLLAPDDGSDFLVVAAYNGLERTTLSGSETALRSVLANGGTRLDVPGPWHSPAMEEAVEPFREALVEARPGPFARPMVFNHTGRVEQELARVPDLLAHQLVSPVRWLESMETLRALGVRRVLLVGPSRSIRLFFREVFDPAILVHPVEAPEDADFATRRRGDAA